MVQISMKDNIVKRSTLIPIFVCSGDVARYVSTTNAHPCASSYATKVEGIPKIAKHLSLFFRFSLFFSAISYHRSAVLIGWGRYPVVSPIGSTTGYYLFTPPAFAD